MTWDAYYEVQRLCSRPTPETLLALKQKLDQAGTLSLTANKMGIYSASGVAPQHSSGYQHAWLRDNVMVAFSKWFCSEDKRVRQNAALTVESLQKFLEGQRSRLQEIVKKPALKEEVANRPRIRFKAATLEELPEDWANAQNDALGGVLWLRYLMANSGGAEIAEAESSLHLDMLKYFRAIEYWKDADSGAWEESRKTNCSSIGAVVAATQQIGKYGGANKQVATIAAELYQQGREALDTKLPFESPPQRKADAALLFLIFPFQVVPDLNVQDKILALVRARLMGPSGIRRYIGDSYYCQDYDKWLPSSEQTSDFSQNMSFRDELLVPGQEAQWCLFDPLLSAIYAKRGTPESQPLKVSHFQRAIRQLTPELRCPELYYVKDGRFIPNDHTPLAWTQANLSIALSLMMQTTR